MNLGFCSRCLPGVPLEALAEWAADKEFRSIQIDVPLKAPAPSAPGTFLAAKRRNKRMIRKVRRILDDSGIAVAALRFHANFLTPNGRDHLKFVAHMQRLIKLAARLGVDTVCCPLGRDPGKSLAENLESLPDAFAPVLETAREQGVRVAIENGPRIGDPFEGLHGNVAFSPSMWEEIFDRMADRNLGLALDPADLVRQEIDIGRALKEFRKRIFLLHAQDVEIDVDTRSRTGNTVAQGWWRYRVPGLGRIDWSGLIGDLRAIGYDGPLVLTHIDPVWAGREERIHRGLTLGRSHLAKLLT